MLYDVTKKNNFEKYYNLIEEFYEGNTASLFLGYNKENSFEIFYDKFSFSENSIFMEISSFTDEDINKCLIELIEKEKEIREIGRRNRNFESENNISSKSCNLI